MNILLNYVCWRSAAHKFEKPIGGDQFFVGLSVFFGKYLHFIRSELVWGSWDHDWSFQTWASPQHQRVTTGQHFRFSDCLPPFVSVKGTDMFPFIISLGNRKCACHGKVWRVPSHHRDSILFFSKGAFDAVTCWDFLWLPFLSAKSEWPQTSAMNESSPDPPNLKKGKESGSLKDWTWSPASKLSHSNDSQSFQGLKLDQTWRVTRKPIWIERIPQYK